MVTKESLDDLALRWEKWVVDTNELIADSDQLGIPISNAIHYLWNDLRVYVQGLPAQIRGGGRVGQPLERHDEDPDQETDDDR